MNRFFQIFLVAVALWVSPAVSRAQAETDTGTETETGKRFSIEIITVDPGVELFSRWGHICIMVVDRQNNSRLVYNFGTFAFDDPGLLFRYAKGYLNFWVSIVPYGPMIEYYRYEGRRIVSRTLDLTDQQAQTVAKRLAVYTLPENRTYAYRHYLDNCCTRIRDLINDVLGDALVKKFDTKPTGRSYRYYTRRALTGLPVMRNVILFIMGREIDRPVTRYDEQFLPEVFAEDLDKITIGKDHRPLVSKREVIFAPKGPPPGEARSTWEYVVSAAVLITLLLGLGLPLALAVNRRRWVRRLAGVGLLAWGLLAGLGGLLVVLLWTATLHYDCHKNENVLVFPVLHLLLLGPGVKLLFTGRLKTRTNRLFQKYLIAALALLAVNLLLKLGPFFQQNYQFIFFAALMNGAALFVLKRMENGEETNATAQQTRPSNKQKTPRKKK